MFPFLLGQQVYIPDTSPKASGSQAHKEKWSVPLDVDGSTRQVLGSNPGAGATIRI